MFYKKDCRTQHSRYQNLKLMLPELNTHVTRTQHSRYQNQTLMLPELNTTVTITIINRYWSFATIKFGFLKVLNKNKMDLL